MCVMKKNFVRVVCNPINQKCVFSKVLTRSLWEPGGPCTKSMEVSESCMEWVNVFLVMSMIFLEWYVGILYKLDTSLSN